MKHLLLFLFFTTTLSCSNAQTKNLTPAEFKTQTAQTSKKIILDVRTDGEVAQGIIEGAQQIDFNASDFDAKISVLDKNTPVYVYCAAGGRSSKTAKQLEQKGFKSVFNLSGGITAWRNAGFPTASKK